VRQRWASQRSEPRTRIQRRETARNVRETRPIGRETRRIRGDCRRNQLATERCAGRTKRGGWRSSRLDAQCLTHSAAMRGAPARCRESRAAIPRAAEASRETRTRNLRQRTDCLRHPRSTRRQQAESDAPHSKTDRHGPRNTRRLGHRARTGRQRGPDAVPWPLVLIRRSWLRLVVQTTPEVRAVLVVLQDHAVDARAVRAVERQRALFHHGPQRAFSRWRPRDSSDLQNERARTKPGASTTALVNIGRRTRGNVCRMNRLMPPTRRDRS
jgi:hypothetical protein